MGLSITNIIPSRFLFSHSHMDTMAKNHFNEAVGNNADSSKTLPGFQPSIGVLYCYPVLIMSFVCTFVFY